MYIVEIENEARQLMKYVEFNSIYVIYIWGSLNSMDQYCVPSIIASVGMHKAASIYVQNGIPSFKLQCRCFTHAPVALSLL